MRKITTKLFGLALTALLGIGVTKADHLSDRLTFSARLQPASGVTTNANGVGAFMLNSNKDTLYFTTSVTKLSSPLVGFHIHNGRTGGNVIFDFDGMVESNTVRSYITGSDLTSSLLSDLIEGNLYLAAHTENNPAVEVLGFIKLESDWGFEATINGLQANSNSMAQGLATINFGMKGDTAIVRVATDLSNQITAVHFHYGKQGQNGGVALGLDNLIAMNGTSLNGGLSINSGTWTTIMTALMSDSLYINVHTASYPNGEIRGQLKSTKTLRFDSWLNTAAINAGGGTINKPSSGNGISSLWLNNTMDTLHYSVFFSGLSSSASAAHFHMGEANQSGGVVKELTISGNWINGIWTKSDATGPLTNSLISNLLSGSLYLVVHTDSNANGELRGQVYRLAREGFIGDFDGKQAMTLSNGKGSVIASYDRDRTNLHYMMAFDNLTSDLSSAHIHKAIKGESGSVVYDLGVNSNNGFYNYWKATDGFNNSQSLPLRRGDSLYVNIHTTNFANGEIRAQLMRNYVVKMPTITPPIPETPDFLSDRLTFSARLNPITGITTGGNGVGAFMLNSTRDTLYFTLSATNLSSKLTGYHIHNGRTGGNVIIDFDGKIDGTNVRSFITGSQLTNLWNDFMDGNLYIAVHTENNPAVEILGSIKLEADWGFAASLDGMQASSNSMAVGQAALNFGMKGDTVSVRLVSNLSNPISAVHLHYGKAGQQGGVALALDDLVSIDGISMLGGIKITPADWTNLLVALMSDSVYLNLHTATFPNGEIRGQVRTNKNLRFDAWLNQKAITDAGVVPMQISMGYGVSTLSLNNTMDTLSFSVLVNGLTSTATNAHIHNANSNNNGSVVKELTINGNAISGIWTKTDSDPLSAQMVSELLMGNLYFVVHTTTNPGGELRGQIYRLAREGFIAEINGMQANTESKGLGTAVASYDRDRTNLHSMMAVEGLQSEITSAHIHFGKKGETGAVAIDLDPITNNGSYKYSKAIDNFFDATSIAMRREDATYVNIHTTTAAAGEVRGQLMRYYRISSPSITLQTGVAESILANASNISVFPNPTKDLLNINFNAKTNAIATILIYNLNGQVVSSQTSEIIVGENNLKTQLDNLNIGFYVAEIQFNGETASRVKILKN